MNDTPDKCPRCQSPLVDVEDNKWTCMASPWRESALCAERVAHQKAEAERDAAVDALDLHRDEMRRILARMAENPDNAESQIREIKGIAERAITDIPQLVPVIEQRDRAERERDKAQRDLDTAIASVVMIRCTKHVKVPKLNQAAFNGGECAACVADDLSDTRRKLEEALSLIKTTLRTAEEDDGQGICHCFPSPAEARAGYGATCIPCELRAFIAKHEAEKGGVS